MVARFWVDGWDKEPFSSRYDGFKSADASASVCRIIEGFFPAPHRSVVLHSDRSIFTCVVSLAPDEENASLEDALFDCCESARLAVEDAAGVSCTAGMSDIREGYTGIQEANLHARRAVEYRIVYGKRRVIRYTELDERPFVPNKLFPDRARGLLTAYVKSADQSSFEVFYRIRGEYMGGNFITPETVASFVSNLNAVTADVAAAFNSQLDRNENFVILKAGDTLDDISKRFGYIFFKLNEEHRTRGAQTDLGARIREYIAGHYSDPALCVNAIGYQFSLTPSYCSRVFKDAVGVTIPAYILDLRIRAARERLTATDDSIDLIARETGFSSSSVFIRQFHRQCGVTPGAYRASFTSPDESSGE